MKKKKMVAVQQPSIKNVLSNKNVSLNVVYETIDKWLYVPDKKLIDTILATALSRRIMELDNDLAIWLAIVTASSGGKTTLLEGLLTVPDFEQLSRGELGDVIELPEITSKTLNTRYKKAEPLAPKLKNKLVIIPESGRLLNVNAVERRAIFGQLRDLYDKNCARWTGSDTTYDKLKDQMRDINVTLIIGCVPTAERHLIMEQLLGTRFLTYRCNDINEQKVLDKAETNFEHEAQMKSELNQVFRSFIDVYEKKELWNNIEIDDDVKVELRVLSKKLVVMRAMAEIDSYSQMPKGVVSKESPTRCYKQFLRMFKCLMSLDENYSKLRALEVLEHIAYSSGSRERQRILERFEMGFSKQWVTNKDMVRAVRLPFKIVRRECTILWMLKILDRIDNLEGEGEAWSLISQ